MGFLKQRGSECNKFEEGKDKYNAFTKNAFPSRKHVPSNPSAIYFLRTFPDIYAHAVSIVRVVLVFENFISVYE